MKKIILILFIVVVNLTGCESVTHLDTVGGSKSDGTIKLGYEANLLNILGDVKIDKEETLNQVRERCKSWGYSDAMPFSGKEEKCIAPGTDPGGCFAYRITYTYQCIN
ncbi:YecR family lipoprotein [Thorsellia anophelis]|uniref:YecR-like lipoprotein n=1 Tax=Thorsellia anophelis DSM 18579 TaxID=1123402 RepID=A0A1H9Y7P0_9GAMM|nr:YecR family lipoprotein [Thorsellia anophelis]SES64829.1 YecR-like lipoprotein [Thorsellia anophelis DSM 18579]